MRPPYRPTTARTYSSNRTASVMRHRRAPARRTRCPAHRRRRPRSACRPARAGPAGRPPRRRRPPGPARTSGRSRAGLDLVPRGARCPTAGRCRRHSGTPTIGWLPNRVAVTGTPASGMSTLSGALGRYGFVMRTLTVRVCGRSPLPVTVTRSHTRPVVVPASTEKSLRPSRATGQVHQRARRSCRPARPTGWRCGATALGRRGTGTRSGKRAVGRGLGRRRQDDRRARARLTAARRRQAGAEDDQQRHDRQMTARTAPSHGHRPGPR